MSIPVKPSKSWINRMLDNDPPDMMLGGMKIYVDPSVPNPPGWLVVTDEDLAVMVEQAKQAEKEKI